MSEVIREYYNLKFSEEALENLLFIGKLLGTSGKVYFKYRGLSCITCSVPVPETPGKEKILFEAYDGRDCYRGDTIGELDIVLDKRAIEIDREI